MTDAEVKAEFVQRLGPERGPFLHKLRNQLLTLHVKWEQYCGLFGASPARLNLLNSIAPFYFYITNDVMYDDVLLHIARLTDRPKRGRGARFTIRRLPGLFSGEPIALTLDAEVSAALNASDFVWPLRNKRIGHLNLAHALERFAQPLQEPSREQIESALAALREVFHLIERHYFNTEGTWFEIRPTGDVEALLYHLRVARDAREAREQRLREGRLLPDDFKPPQKE